MKFRLSCLLPRVLVLLLTVASLIPLRLAKGQCPTPPVTFVSRTGSTNATRYGYQGPTLDSNGYAQYFHQYHESETVDNLFVSFFHNWTATLNSDTKTQLNPLSGAETTNSITGTFQTDDYLSGFGEVHYYGSATNVYRFAIPRCGWWEYQSLTYYSSPDVTTYATNQDYDYLYCNSAQSWVKDYFCIDYLSETDTTNATSITQDFEGNPGDGSSRSDVLIMSCENKFDQKEINAGVSLSNNYITNNQAGDASFLITGQGPTSFSAVLSKFEYQLGISNTVRGATYNCSYQKITTIADSTGHITTYAPSVMKGIVVGTGDPTNLALGSVLREDVPSDPGTSIYVTSPVVVSVKMPDSGPNLPPGSGRP